MRRFWCIISSLLTMTVIISVSFSGQRVHKFRRNLIESFVRMTKEDFNSNPEMKSDDPHLLSYIRRKYLDFPLDLPYSIPSSSFPFKTYGQNIVVDEIFRQKTNGVFVEAGAYDGVSMSNTLHLEKYRNWTGLLVEPDPRNYKKLKNVNRKSILSNSCLSTSGFPIEVNLQSSIYGYLSKTFSKENQLNFNHNFELRLAQCFPLESLLLAANIKTIDYFSLDVEGYELEVLKKFPFENFTIKVISVEFQHISGGESALTDFLRSKNFSPVRQLTWDIIYVHSSLLKDLNIEEIASINIKELDLFPIKL